MAEPVALGISVPKFDAAEFATKGMNLGLLGLRPAQIAQQLAMGREEILGQQLAHRETQRAYEMQTRKDEQRKRAAEIQKQFQKKDADGKDTFDFEGGLAEMRRQGIDPDTTAEVERNWVTNAAEKIKTNTDKDKFLQTWMTDTFSAARGMAPAKAAQYLQSRAKQASSSFGIPEEEMHNRFTAALGITPGTRLSADELPARIQGAVNARTISEREERGLTTQGVSSAQADPNSPVNKVVMNALRQITGRDYPEGVTPAQLKAAGVLSEDLARAAEMAQSFTPSAGERLSLGVDAADMLSRANRIDAALNDPELKRMTSSIRPEAWARDKVEQFFLTPAGTEFRAVADILVKEGKIPEGYTSSQVGMQNAMRVVQSYNNELKSKASSRKDTATSPKLAGSPARGQAPADAQEQADAARGDTGSQLAARQQELKEIEASMKKAEKTMSTSSGDKYRVARDQLRDLQKVKEGIERDIKASGLDKAPKKDNLVAIRIKGTDKVKRVSREEAKRFLADSRFEEVR